MDGGWCLEEALRLSWILGRKRNLASGGEASYRWTFWLLFTKAQELGIHCTLDTCALPFGIPRYLGVDRLMAVTDLVLLDIKEINDERQNCDQPYQLKYLSDIGKTSLDSYVLVLGWRTEMMTWSSLENLLRPWEKRCWNPSSYHEIQMAWVENSYRIGRCETANEQVKNAKDDGNESYQDYLKRVKRIKEEKQLAIPTVF